MKQYLQNKAIFAFFFASVLWMFLLPTDSWAGDPDISYRTLKTDHFSIHFDQKLEKLARRVAVTAENVHTIIGASLGWTVEGTVQIHIVDSTDSSNGLATPYRYPFIELYATPPGMDSSLLYQDNYLYSLLLHEYTHVTHLQMQYGIARIYNSAFGDLFLPNALQPNWFIEGLAVMMETYRTSRGRIRSAYYHMVMRTHSLEGTFQSLAQVSNVTTPYPRGDADYIYGGMFLSYLRERFGEEAIFSICHEYARKPIPYGINRLFEEETGVPLTELYSDWAQAVLERSEAVAAEVRKKGETESVRVTHSGESKGQPIIDDVAGELILSQGDGLKRSGISVLSLSDSDLGKEKRQLVLAGSDASVSMNGAGDLYYVRSAPFKDNYRFRDLFVLEKGAASERRLTHGARTMTASVSLQGDRVVMVTNARGQTKLELADSEGQDRTVLLAAQEGVQYYAPTFSPDGGTVAFIMRRQQRVDVAVLDVQTGHHYYVTSDGSIEQSLRFTADGRYLLFTSEVGGILNIFARDMRSGQLKKVTNVVTGASKPAITKDGKTLYFIKYYSHGWDVHRMAVDLDALPPFSPPSKRTETMPELYDVSAQKGPYNPLPSFRPYAWEVGFMAMGSERSVQLGTYLQDAAMLHQMSVAFDYEFTARNPNFSAMYLYSGLLPQFQLEFSYAATPIADGYLVGGVARPWTRESYVGHVGFSIPLLGLNDNHSLSFGYTLNESAPKEALTVEADPNGDLPDIPTQYFRTGVRLAWSYSDIYAGPKSISREDGRLVYAGLTLYHPSLGGDREQLVLGWRWREYRLAPWGHHHVFALGVEGQVYVSNPNHQGSIRAGGYVQQPIWNSMLNQTVEGLPDIRGYAPDSISGDHFHSLRLEYRFPIWRAELAYETLPVFFKHIYGAVFSDNLLMSYDHFKTEDYYTSMGAELVWSFYLGYHLPMVLRTGYSRGFMEKGENEFFLVVGGTY